MIWRTSDGTRFFLIPDDRTPPPGDVAVTTLTGTTARTTADWLTPFEITEEQARRVATDQLGDALGEVRGAIDDKLAQLRTRLDAFNRTPVSDSSTVTPDAGPALLDLMKNLPRAIGQSLSAEPARVDAARETLTALQDRLKAAGVDVGTRLEEFPERLARLRGMSEE